ncbi:hypothetical protein PanWU01x14_297530, partial [Parasponia andersonii]
MLLDVERFNTNLIPRLIRNRTRIAAERRTRARTTTPERKTNRAIKINDTNDYSGSAPNSRAYIHSQTSQQIHYEQESITHFIQYSQPH